MKMKEKINFSLLHFAFSMAVMFLALSEVHVNARKHHAKKSNLHSKCLNKDKTASTCGRSPVPAPPPLPPLPAHSSGFNIFSFGAKGDGISDDSTALTAAWNSACKVEGSSLIIIPPEFKFLIEPITLQGPCLSKISLQIDGTLFAPPNVGSWPKSGLFQWINFKWVHNFTIQGSGVVDGQGFQWWNSAYGYDQIYSFQKKLMHIPDMKPTAVRFYASSNVTVRDIKIINSPQCHLKFDSSRSIRVYNLTVSSPASSPNTDGIHLQNTQDVEIHHSNFACGDDCVSIQTGCSAIHIHHINCGPGHGISLGGLGKDGSTACVSDVVVQKISLQNTLAGVRIKTWQGGMGWVRNITFSDIQVSQVKVPVVIDQFYCNNNKSCKNQTAAVAISGVRYSQIRGTYSVQPVHLACSDSVPCVDVDLVDIQLKQSGAWQENKALCWNSYGKSQAPLLPSSVDSCVRREAASLKRFIARSREHIC